MKPMIIVITGTWGTGKTHMLSELSRRLEVPGFSRDAYKERRYDAGERGDFDAWSYDALFADLVVALQRSKTCIIESDTEEDQVIRLLDIIHREGARVIQIHLFANDRTLHERIIHRITSGERHPGHGDERFLKEEQDALTSSEAKGLSRDPLKLPGELVEVDTTDFHAVDYDAVVRNIISFLDVE